MKCSMCDTEIPEDKEFSIKIKIPLDAPICLRKDSCSSVNCIEQMVDEMSNTVHRLIDKARKKEAN